VGFPTKVQLIRRKGSRQWYVNFPSAVAEAMEFERGEIVEWIIEDKSLLALRRLQPPPRVLKQIPCASGSSHSSGDAAPPREAPSKGGGKSARKAE